VIEAQDTSNESHWVNSNLPQQMVTCS